MINDEKEMISAINDILNPYSDATVEILAWRMIEDGWHKRSEAEWLQFSIPEQPWVFKCSNCNYLTRQMTPYCPECGAKMRKPEGVE